MPSRWWRPAPYASRPRAMRSRCRSAAPRSPLTSARSSRAAATCWAASSATPKRPPVPSPRPRCAWMKRDATKARQFLQAALGGLRRGHESTRDRDVERPGLRVRRRLSRGLPALHGGAEPDQLLRRQDRRGIHPQARKIAATREGPMRGALLAVLACVCMSAVAAPAVPTSTVESTGLRSIAGWLKTRGVPGYVGADVADAMGIPRATGAELIDALQRGFRDDEVLRIAQYIDGEYVLFMVQRPGEVQLWLSTGRGGP